MKLFNKYTITFLACSLSLNAPNLLLTQVNPMYYTGETTPGFLKFGLPGKTIYTPVEYNYSFLLITEKALLDQGEALKKIGYPDHQKVANMARQAIATIRVDQSASVDAMIMSKGLAQCKLLYVNGYFILFFGCKTHPNAVQEDCWECQSDYKKKGRDLILNPEALIKSLDETP